MPATAARSQTNDSDVVAGDRAAGDRAAGALPGPGGRTEYRTGATITGYVAGAPAGDARPPELAPGVELLGPYRGSGFRETPFLLRVGGGPVLQVSHLLYLVAAEVDGRRQPADIAPRVSQGFGRRVSPDNVRFLVEHKLRPLGVVAGPAPAPAPAAPAVLGLGARFPLLSAPLAARAGAAARPLFRAPVVVVVVAGLAAFDSWMFFVHGAGTGLHQALSRPTLMLVVFGLLILAAAFHELGHAAACHHGGARPGAIGVGLYLAWPAFYSDVTDSYRLDRRSRLRVDLGGVYFNAVFDLVVAAAYLATGFEPLVVFIVVQHLEMAYQFMPFVRLDGYYLVADLTGVPDLFPRVKPVLASLLPGRRSQPALAELRPRARRLLAGWVLLSIPVLAVNAVLFVLRAPDLAATAWISLVHQLGQLGAAVRAGAPARAGAGVVGVVTLVLPLAAMSMTIVRILGRATTGARRRRRRRRWSRQAPSAGPPPLAPA
ncbi:MAG: hypothetical protein LC792_21500, partial [Actinobacteria bacterium]|nr:hypothetical protein [Actinomycetota bacterium]